jgi:hypothetical protein
MGFSFTQNTWGEGGSPTTADQLYSIKIHLVYPGTIGYEFTSKVIGDYRNETMVH